MKIAEGHAERANLEDYLRLPNARLHVFSRVGHFVPTDVPDEFVGVLRDFMQNRCIGRHPSGPLDRNSDPLRVINE